ncbi:1-phosphatidylinositol phosphodiesterase [Madurella mycetomatis]|uniref:1-phosphatidylinositol phosphodiesterase n=1 Tax=Madurella mycetomatis TaxID=100816 RepID=A0A175W530_9PEZI|nr:1-phosphatidylinositol phosphodiesterase [Madurella mycetomatis]
MSAGLDMMAAHAEAKEQREREERESKQREAAAKDELYAQDLDRLVSSTQSLYPKHYVVIYFSSAAVVTWSEDTCFLRGPRKEEQLAPSNYGWSESWHSFTAVVAQGEMEYSHPGMQNNPPEWFQPASWMQVLKNDTELKNIAFPASHASFATEQALADYDVLAKSTGGDPRAQLRTYVCQEHSISTQLKMGIRMVDVRFGPETRLSVGPFLLAEFLSSPLHECEQFVSDNPTETVAVWISWNGASFDEPNGLIDTVVEIIRARPALWYTSNRWPALSEVRGKCILFRSFGSAPHKPGLGINVSPEMLELLVEEGTHNSDSLDDQDSPLVAVLTPWGDRTRGDNKHCASSLGAKLRESLRNAKKPHQGLWIFQDFVQGETVELIARMNWSVPRQ